jgi:hypothetical protein
MVCLKLIAGIDFNRQWSMIQVKRKPKKLANGMIVVGTKQRIELTIEFLTRPLILAECLRSRVTKAGCCHLFFWLNY